MSEAELGAHLGERDVRGEASFPRRPRCRLRGAEAEDQAASLGGERRARWAGNSALWGGHCSGTRGLPSGRGVLHADPLWNRPILQLWETEPGNAQQISLSAGKSGSQRPERQLKGRGEGRRTATLREASWSFTKLCSVSWN